MLAWTYLLEGSAMEPDDIPVDGENGTRACPDCDSSGFDGEDGSPCGNCGGLGYVVISECPKFSPADSEVRAQMNTPPLR